MEILAPLLFLNKFASDLLCFRLSQDLNVLQLLLLHIDVHHDHAFESLALTECRQRVSFDF